MKKTIIFLAIFLLAMSASVKAQDASSSARNQTIAFVGVNVIPMDKERVLKAQTVLIKNGTIAEIVPAAGLGEDELINRCYGRAAA